MSKRLFAISLGITCHLLFLGAVSLMAWSIFYGMTKAVSPIGGEVGRYLNLLLLFQFPIVHSILLTKNGQNFLRSLTFNRFGYDLNTTWFALFSSLQLSLVFIFWTPSAGHAISPHGLTLTLWGAVYAGSWLLLAKTMFDAGLALQLGSLGWMAVAKEVRPKYPVMPKTGTFRFCRQPIYLAFFLIILTAPFWGLDHLILLLIWGAYCFIGPLLKERRYQKIYGNNFDEFKKLTPYIIPRRPRTYGVVAGKQEQNPLIHR